MYPVSVKKMVIFTYTYIHMRMNLYLDISQGRVVRRKGTRRTESAADPFLAGEICA